MDVMEEAKSFLCEGTSPSILQDITMDKSSPCPSPAMEASVPETPKPNEESLVMVDSDLSVSSHPSDDDSSDEMDARGATGMTMKEYDDNLKKLTAENFQLKLKIYFLNERLRKINGIQDKELINENVMLKVDNEQKAQEVERQSKLLIEALEAIEQIQSEHQQEMSQLISKHQREIVDSQVRVGALETRIRLLQDSPDLKDINNIACNAQLRDIEEKLNDSSAKVKELETVNNELKAKLVQLEEDAKLAQTHSEEKTRLLDQIKTYQNQLLKLQNQATALETNAETPHDELKAELSARTAELAELQTTYDRACDTIKSCIRRVLDERNEIKRLEEELTKARLTIQTLEIRQRDSDPTDPTFAQQKLDSNCQCGVKETLARINKLEDEMLILKTEMGPAGDLSTQLMAKECEIETIKRDLKKRTHFLRELWDENRQIEKPEKILMGVDDVEQLKKDIKILSAEKRALSDELSQIKDKEMTVKEACFMLTKRLEELAGFLDSLISDRSLVELNGETCNAIRRAIDSSRELSRRLTLSFDEASLLSRREQISVVYCEDDSRRESEPFIVTARESEKRWLELELPDESDEEDKPRSPAGIRKKVETFCARALGHTFKGEMDASESEAWSEPDRSVSLARMGHIDSTSVTPLRLSKSKNSSGSSEETLNETGHRSSGKRNRSMDSDMRKLQNKVKSLEETNKDLRAQLMLLENKHVILSKLNDHTSPQLLLEIQESLTELDETRELCQRLKSDLAAARGDLAVARQDLDAKERLCTEQANALAKMETKADDVVLEYELRIIELIKEKDAAIKRAQAMEETLAAAEKMRIDLESQVVEINRKLNEAQAWKDKSKAQVKEAGRHLDSCEKLLQEKTEYEKKIRELQLFVECLQKNVEEKQSEVDSWTARAQREHNEMTELKRRLLETERSKSVVESKIKEQGESMKWLEEKIREVEQATDQCGRETEAKIGEEVRRRFDMQMKETKREWVPRVDLERAHKNIEALEKRLSSNEEAFKERADFLIKKLNRIETEKRDWCRQMNDLRLRSSEMEVELTRLANDKVRLEEELQKAVDKHLEVSRQREIAEATKRNSQKQVEYESSSTSFTAASASFHDYFSTRNLNSSPDLGIESDQGRFSSLEHQDQRTPRVDGNMNRLEAENEELRQQLEKMSRNLEETAAELAAANYQKKQMERAICKQLHKTHHMLKEARRNFEQDSDSVDDR